MAGLFVRGLQVATCRTTLTVWVVLPAEPCIYTYSSQMRMVKEALITGSLLLLPKQGYLYHASAVLQPSTPAYAFGPQLTWVRGTSCV